MDGTKKEIERIIKQIKIEKDKEIAIKLQINELTKRKLELQKRLNQKN